MTVYCGVDFHARQQTICYRDPAGGEVRLRELRHEQDDVRRFYSAFAGEVVVGIEASGYSTGSLNFWRGSATACSSATAVSCAADRQHL